MSLAGHRRIWRAAGVLTAAFAVVTALAWAILSLSWPVTPVDIHVRWKPDVTDAQRAALERQLQLTGSERTEGTTWRYRLTDTSTAGIRAVVQNEQVDDTEHLNRVRYRPEFAQDRSRQILMYSVAVGAVGSALLVLLIPVPPFGRVLQTTPASAPAARPDHAVRPDHDWRATAVVAVAGLALAAAMTWLAGASFLSATAAVVIVYACGYGVGSLLIDHVESQSAAVIRTVAGLLLTTIGFLLSLVLLLPWFTVPGGLLAAALILRRRAAVVWPHRAIGLGWDGVTAGILAVVLLLPIVITFFYMAPGGFPPVFYNIDTAYFMEKVHALVAADSYPPPSLSNVGIRRTYHYGTQAMAAFVSRGSGLLPHHALFLIVLPLLTAGVVAAAAAVARYVAPALPRSIAVPLLLISVPSLSTSFWAAFGPRLGAAVMATERSIDGFVGDAGLWGFLSNEGQNIGGDFVVLGSIAGIAAAPSWGWRLPAFLIGSAILVKTPVGIALFAGFALADTWRTLVEKRRWPSPALVMAGATFVATVVVFFLISFQSEYRVEPFPAAHLMDVVRSGVLPGFLLDVLWLFLPALIVLSAGVADSGKRSAPLLIMAMAPVLIVNATRLDNTSTGAGGTGGDWIQILHPVPFLLHAFVLSLASRRWARLDRGRRTAVLAVIVLAIVPVAAAAARYSLPLLSEPERGYEFVDNRSLAEALAVIPTRGTIVVTNDLRYPADHFTRDYRQMQIPALFGHQAYAVNYAHEAVEERRGLQTLLQQPEWSGAISEAARTHHWTHLIVRKDYAHPAAIPLEQIFENASYAVFRFQ